MNHYEVMYVIDTAIDDKSRQDLIARFSELVASNEGSVDRVDEWGKRRLAYPINYKTEGYYVLMYITAPSTLPKELERNLQISDDVLRYLVIRFDGTIPPKREPLKPASHAVDRFVETPAAPVAEAAPVASDAVAGIAEV